MQPLFTATIPDASIITGAGAAFAALIGAVTKLYNDGRLDRKAASEEREKHLQREGEFVAALNALTDATEKLAERNGKAS